MDMIAHFKNIYPDIKDNDTLLLYKVRHVRELSPAEAKQARVMYGFNRKQPDLMAGTQVAGSETGASWTADVGEKNAPQRRAAGGGGGRAGGDSAG